MSPELNATVGRLIDLHRLPVHYAYQFGKFIVPLANSLACASGPTIINGDIQDEVKKIVYGRVQLQNATALLHFSKKGRVQQLIHNLKYKGHEHISEFFGKWLAADLSKIEAYRSIDVVIPVPLYKTKLKQRGYNQVNKFGKEIAKALNAEYNDYTLIKTKSTQTKVLKDRLSRWNNDGTVFTILDDQSLQGKHILLVDDIITTGATVEACATELLKIDAVILSLATMAIAD